MSEALARFLFQQLILALDFCHRKGKVSRDVKLANTLLVLAPQQLPLVKLCDFGFSKDSLKHSEAKSQVRRSTVEPLAQLVAQTVCSQQPATCPYLSFPSSVHHCHAMAVAH